MPKRLTETTPLNEAGATASRANSGRLKVAAISAGLGSSGLYTPKVLEQAATDRLIDKGTPLFFDHPTDTEAMERPARSVRDIAAVFTEAATYDAETQALVGEVQVFTPYRDLVAEMGPYIGLSIRGSATDVTEGEHEGRKVPVIEGLHSIDSVDLVTKAGRGGQVLELIESARFISEATASDRARQLSDAVRAAHGGRGVYVWVRDQDADARTVWFEISRENDSGSHTYQQSYDVGANDVDITLTGTPVEVRQLTNYVAVAAVAPTIVPVTRPDSTTPTTEADQEVTMGNIQIEESEHRSLVEKAGRVDALESESATKDARIKELEEADARRTRTDRARALVAERATEAGVTFTEREVKGFLADMVVMEDGSIDEEKFTTLVDEDAAAKAKAGGAGSVSGFGGTPTGDPEISESDIDNVVAGAFGRTVKEA